MSYDYFYLLWTLLFGVVWLLLYLHRKDLRREMLYISILFGIGGVISQKLFIQDWWQPLTITGTPIGIEDFLIGSAIGGIAAVSYAELYHKKLSPKRRPDRASANAFLLTFAGLFLGLFYIGGMTSFYAAIIAYLCGIGLILLKRKDLFIDSLASGLILLVLGSAVYLSLFLLYPDYITDFWYLRDTWYSTLILGIPLAEYIWFFLTGAFVGPLYEFVKEKRVVTKR